MSGGSFNYLCEARDFDTLVRQSGSLEEMAAALSALGYAPDAARETEELLVQLRQWETRATVRVERLRDVWKAVEWFHSSDWGESRIHEALAAYRGETPPVVAAAPADSALASDAARHVVLAKPGDLLVLGNVGNLSMAQLDHLRNLFAAELGVRVAFAPGDVTIGLQSERAPANDTHPGRSAG